jgi:fibronectin type 3 domain-containing protein
MKNYGSADTKDIIRRKTRGQNASSFIFEVLEPRRLMAATPTNVGVSTDGPNYTLAWDLVQGADGYRIYKSDHFAGIWAPFPDIPAGISVRSDPTTATQKYDYYVVSLENGVESAPSQIVSPELTVDRTLQLHSTSA